ncbi:MAG: hypothetical protein AAF907_07815, partial [Planctomycetota bacterium]
MSDSSPTQPPAEEFDDASDDALTALLRSVPLDPAPAGFRDRTLGLLDADQSDPQASATGSLAATDPPTEPAAAIPADSAPVPAGPVRPSKPLWRRSLEVVGGVALTAATLAGVAIFWSQQTAEDAAIGVTASEPSSESFSEINGYLGAGERAAGEEFAADDERMLAGLAPPARGGVGAGADSPEGRSAGDVAPAMLPMTRAAGRDDEFVRVVRVRTASLASNLRAVEQFETAALQNSIVPIAPDVAGRAFGVEAEGFGDQQGAELPPLAPQSSGPVNVLVMAEPERFEQALKDFQSDLAATDAGGDVQIAEEPRLSALAANRLILRQQSNGRFPDPADAPAPRTRQTDGESGGAVAGRREGETKGDGPDGAQAMGLPPRPKAGGDQPRGGLGGGGLGGGGFSGGVEPSPFGAELQFGRRAGEQFSRSPFQMRLPADGFRPAPGPALNKPETESAVAPPAPPAPADTAGSAERPEANEPARDGASGGGALNESDRDEAEDAASIAGEFPSSVLEWDLRELSRRSLGDLRVPILLVFEPPTPAASPG